MPKHVDWGFRSCSTDFFTMIIRHTNTVSLPSFLLPSLLRPQCQQLRHLHRRVIASDIPAPTPFVPDSKTFLSLIGRNLSRHAAKIPSWKDLFTYSSQQLREAGVEPARERRYLLWWIDRFRKGIYGIGGDLKHVVDSTAHLRLVEVPLPPDAPNAIEPSTGLRRVQQMVVNLPPDTQEQEQGGMHEELRTVKGVKVRGAHSIVGPYIQPVKGTEGRVAILKPEERMWEVRRGIKVDGGERRKKMVRRQRRLEEARDART